MNMDHLVLSFYPGYIAFRCSDGRTGTQPGNTTQTLQTILNLFPNATIEAHNYYKPTTECIHDQQTTCLCDTCCGI